MKRVSHKKNNKIKYIVILTAILLAIAVSALFLKNTKQNSFNQAQAELLRTKQYEQFVEGDEDIEGTDNVKFSAFFLRDTDLDGYAEKVKGACRKIGQEDTLYMELNVQTEGYLKDAKIEIDGKNFYLQMSHPKDDELKENYIGNNIKEIELNQINSGTQKLISGIVRSGDYSYSTNKKAAIGNNINNLSRTDNKIILTGIYVSEDGTETEIRKEIDLTIDWHGDVKAAISAITQNSYNAANVIDEEKGTAKLDVSISVNETQKLLNLSRVYIKGTIPKLNGYDPLEVVFFGDTSETLKFNYDEETKDFTIEQVAVVQEDGLITNSVSNNSNYSLEIFYPKEAYPKEDGKIAKISVPLEAAFEGYNNPNLEFDNPYKSNIAKATIIASYMSTSGIDDNLSIMVEKNIVSKDKPLKIYNGISEKEEDDTYIVAWILNTGDRTENASLILKENKDEEQEIQVTDEFIKNDGTLISMEEVTSNIGIYFKEPELILKEDGWIKVYDDETDNLLVTFDKSTWSKYDKNNPYMYDLPVKHIRVETSQTNKSSSFNVYNIKELDCEYITSNYSKEEFENLAYIKSTVNGYIDGMHLATREYNVKYQTPYSIATISIGSSQISTQATKEDAKIVIDAKYDKDNNQVGWKDGSFLVKLPEEILDVQLKSVEIDNDNVEITSYELIEDAQKFIKINTKNKLENQEGYEITIRLDISPDPRTATATRIIELYAYNSDASTYFSEEHDIYDVNNNLNTEELVNKSSTSITLISPNTLLTNQIASEYDLKNSIAISPEVVDIQPKYVKVDNENQTAKIGVQLKNNYASTISEVKILGKIPFKGNKTVLGGKDLKSEFTTKMLEEGISVPEELEGIVSIYYSENENPNTDLNDSTNNWKTLENIDNYSNVKTFLIDFEDYILKKGASFTFSYKVEIPQGIEFNKVSYSHHGIYFCLDTDQGKYRTQTEPNKLGFRIAEKFNLELIKTQKGKEKLVPEATYSINEVQEDGTLVKSQTAVTNEDGLLAIKDLYAERIYEIQELKTPNDYELNEDIVRFIGHVDENGTLTVEKIKGDTKEEISVTKNEGEKHKVAVEVEDEVKAKLKIVKKEFGTENGLKNIKYRLKGKGFVSSGRILTTDTNGETIINGLSIGEEYILEETKAEGYYLGEPVKFKIINNDGIYSLEIIEGTIVEESITEENDFPTAILTLENEKIPTYNLEITKIKKNIETELSSDISTENSTEDIVYLQGAKFKLYEGTKEIGEYTTDENGKILIDNLCQYVEGKNIDATYTLKEIVAPTGYTKAKDKTFKVQNINGTLTLTNINGKEEKYAVDGNTVKLTVEDSPSFKLIKKDAETGEVLANVKFALYNVENGVAPATNSKGEILGTKEIINGKEYYTVTTDNNGIITVDLPEGLYQAVEVQAPEKYDIEGSVYYFGIGASREGKKFVGAEWAKSVASTDGMVYQDVLVTKDGGYITIGTFYYGEVDFGNGFYFTSNNMDDALIVKYDTEGNVEWADAIGGSGYDKFIHLFEDSDGGYLVWGNFPNADIELKNGTSLQDENGEYVLVKYSTNGEIEWSKQYNFEISSISMVSEKYLIVAYLDENIDLGNSVVATLDGDSTYAVITYDLEGNAQSVELLPGNITSIKETKDNGYIVAGTYSANSIDFGNNIRLSKESTEDTAYLVKYDNKFVAQWAKSYGSDELLLEITNDNGCIIATKFNFEINLSEDNTINGNSGAIIIKYDSLGTVEWYKEFQQVGEDKDDGSFGGLEYDDIVINSILITKENEIIVNGGFGGAYVELENGITLYNSNEFYSVGPPVYISIRNDATFFIKYTENGEQKWATTLGVLTGRDGTTINDIEEISEDSYVLVGSFGCDELELGNDIVLNAEGYYANAMIVKCKLMSETDVIIQNTNTINDEKNEYIEVVSETNDTGYIVGGYFDSSNVNVGDVILSNNGLEDGLLIKYSVTGIPEWYKVIGGNSNDRITDVLNTNDGYLVSGYFESENIDLGNGKILKNNGNADGILIKYSNSGDLEWYKTVGGNSRDSIDSISKSNDNGYFVAGRFEDILTIENDVSIKSNGKSDIMIIKYSQDGNFEWTRTLGGENIDKVNSISNTKDGGYILGGEYSSSGMNIGNGVVLDAASNYSDGFLIKYDNAGNVEWSKTIGTYRTDGITDVIETSDGGFAATGFYEGEFYIENGIQLKSYNGHDAMLIKLNKNGNIEWVRTARESSEEKFNTLIQLADGGFVVGGELTGNIKFGNCKVLVNNGIIKYDSDGKAEWVKEIGTEIKSIAELKDGSLVIAGNTYNNSLYDAYTTRVLVYDVVPEIQELVVENNKKEFRIITTINEIDGIKGGSISGEDENPYEMVVYGNNNTKEIAITPDSGYEICTITINGANQEFSPNEDGSYIMPLFTNITEDILVEVVFINSEEKITIKKVDSETKEGLGGATFEIKTLEDRKTPENILGELTDNGKIYEMIDEENNVSHLLGELTDNGVYSFVEKEDGKYESTNQGQANTTSNSYIPIDLTGVEGAYKLLINAEISTEYSNYGYVAITESAEAPDRYDENVFIYITNTVESKDYESETLEGGKIYYLHLGYDKDGNTNSEEDIFRINNVELYGIKEKQYNFIEVDGKYESTNQGENSTVASSYITLDLTNYEGKYDVLVSIEISSQYRDYGLLGIGTEPFIPNYYLDTAFACVYGETEKDEIPVTYKTTIEGGNKYYLVFAYEKDSNGASGNDKFIIHDVKVQLNDDHIYTTFVTTDSKGECSTEIPFGKYIVTEIVAPDGYKLDDASSIIEFTADGEREFTIENNKLSNIIVHHYAAILNEDGTYEYTETKVEEDDILEGKSGEKYTTSPKLDVEKYELIKDTSGEYIIPDNATGTFIPGETEVTYYYLLKQIPVVVKHYIEGTETPVPLQNGEDATETTYTGAEGETYTTEAISEEELSEKYELVKVPENATGEYKYTDVIVTYYYRVRRFNITTSVKKYEETNSDGEVIEVTGGTILGSEELSYETVKYGETSTKDIIATPDEGYYVQEISVNDKPVEFLANVDGTVSLAKFIDMRENKNVVVTFARQQGTVTVHHYIEGTTEKVPSNVAGQVVEDEIKYGTIGEIFATKPSENVASYYEYSSSSDITSGLYTEENQEVTYYYKLKEFNYTVEYYYDGVKDESKTESNVATYGTVVENYADKVIDGFELEKVENLPLTITENEDTNIIKVYYILKDNTKGLSYTIEYYKDGVLVEDDIQEIVIYTENLEQNTIQVDKTLINTTDKYTGYKLEKTDPEVIPEVVNDGDVIRVYFVKQEFEYTIEYYYDNVLDETKTEKLKALYEEEITTYPDKKENGYELRNAENLPLIISDKSEENIIKIYYIQNGYSYTIKYYYDGILDESKTELFYDYLGAEITTYPEKLEEGYKLERIETLPLVITETPEENVINVYYVRQNAKVIVNYIDKNTNETLDTVEENGYVGQEYTSTEKEIDGYILVERPEKETVVMTEETITLNYYYVKEVRLVERHINIKTKEILSEKVYTGKSGDSYTTQIQNFAGFDIVTNKQYYEEYIKENPDILSDNDVSSLEELLAELKLNPDEQYIPENKDGIMTDEEIIVNYYYLREMKVIVKYYEKDTKNEVAEEVIIEGHEGDSYNTEQKDIKDYKFINKTDNADGIMIPTEDNEGNIVNVILVEYYYEKVVKPDETPDEPDNNPEEQPDDDKDNNPNKQPEQRPDDSQDNTDNQPQQPDNNQNNQQEQQPNNNQNNQQNNNQNTNKPVNNKITNLVVTNKTQDDKLSDKKFPHTGSTFEEIILNVTILVSVVAVFRLLILKLSIKSCEEESRAKRLVKQSNKKSSHKRAKH